ncbi:PAS/PAC and GAF sensor-containing diguanylate cyclase/phosphodiesterase [Pseudomonas sp. M47T1]|uniref:sensor domain-containing protein n=1 Tax=Pseudomonas sp. M47T1 TaxID=1179778 RepID=UPI0002607815|nr:bifunctional diguanylate cyclase/phosphodiesterase [Pseudomonas sp. M47T1]EIK97663.1 PAS/PAC and GAF sensor-containing diguanylate cyclase/phosphodiesterase [Pseudomonas sp. M47T1]
MKMPTPAPAICHEVQPVGSPLASAQLLYELQTHQAELQMQNEELRNAHIALEMSRDRYMDLYENAPVGYLTLNTQGLIEAVNQTGETLLGCSRDHLLNRRFASRVASQERDHWQQVFVRVCRASTPEECELTLRRADGSLWQARLNCVRHDNNPPMVRVSLTDLTARRNLESRLNLAASVFTHAREGIMITDASGIIVEVNDAFSTITGYSRHEAVGLNPRFLASGMTEPAYYAELWRCLLLDHHWQGDLWNRRHDGETFATRQTITAILDPHGRVQNYVSLFTDVTELHEHQRQLEYIAHYDPLTHLPNRVLLASRMQQAMTRALGLGSKLALAYLDLDGFKAINDLHGHDAGDRVLTTVARRMKHTLRDACTLARLGGDEFVALIVDLDQVYDSAPMLERLLAAASDEVQIGELAINLSASIGVSYYPQEGEISADQLLRQADQAMYQAKLAGKNRFHVFDAQHDLDLRGHNARLDRIDRAIREQELRLYYQPKVNLRTGEVVGAEALLRWQHPEKGLLMPDSFLPLIESNSLSEVIGDWVLESALSQVQAWQHAGVRIPVSVNVGARQLQHPDFVANLLERLAAHPDVDPRMLMIEILETSALEDIEGVSHTLRSCAAMGVRFALDDFGTGYSSLSYLKRLPVAQLKIDQTFIQGMLDAPEDISILQAILGLASAFRREIIAEGVDNAVQANRLLQLGCELAQGFGIAQPMPPEALPAWIARWHANPTWQSAPSP